MRVKIETSKIEKVVEKYLTSWCTSYVLDSAAAGVDTNVFKIEYNNEIFWLRIPSQKDLTFKSEVKVHEELIKRGVKLPEVIAHVKKDETIGRALMIIRDMGGMPLNQVKSGSVESVVISAGRDLAIINDFGVNNFGFINDKLQKGELQAEYESFLDFCTSEFHQHLSNIVRYGVFDKKEEAEILRIFEENKELLEIKDSFLIHGDYKPEHIYVRDGQYSGVIDFSDIQGGSNLFDLAHFRAFSEEYYQLLKTGYNEVKPEIDVSDHKIFFFGLVEWVHKLSHVGWHRGRKVQEHIGTPYARKCLDYLLSN